MLLGRADEAIELDCNLLRCLCRLLAQSGHSETICYLSAFGGEADMSHCIVPIFFDANDP